MITGDRCQWNGSGYTSRPSVSYTIISVTNFDISVVSAGTQSIQIHSATAVQAVQINGRVITWSNIVSYLARIIISDKSRQMSVKRVRLNIKAKRRIRDNISHNEQSTHFSHPLILFVTLPQILTAPPHPKDHTSISSHTRSSTCVKLGRKLNCK